MNAISKSQDEVKLDSQNNNNPINLSSSKVKKNLNLRDQR